MPASGGANRSRFGSDKTDGEFFPLGEGEFRQAQRGGGGESAEACGHLARQQRNGFLPSARLFVFI